MYLEEVKWIFNLNTQEGRVFMMRNRMEPFVTLDDRPERDTVIEKDEVVSLIIDLETMSMDDLYEKYFSSENNHRRWRQ